MFASLVISFDISTNSLTNASGVGGTRISEDAGIIGTSSELVRAE